MPPQRPAYSLRAGRYARSITTDGQVRQTILLYARSSAAVLIEETGRAKSWRPRRFIGIFARHDARRAKSHPFVAVNCGAIAESLRKRSCCHEEGAFTGSRRGGAGRIAHGGTLFLGRDGKCRCRCRLGCCGC
ncbi:MAG: sigma 54-interacting transcriptional regulator [Escherichia coli]